MALDRSTGNFNFGSNRGFSDLTEEEIQLALSQAQANKNKLTDTNERAFADVSGQPSFSEGVGKGSQFAASLFLRQPGDRKKKKGGIEGITKESPIDEDIEALMNNPEDFIKDKFSFGGLLRKLFGR